MDLKDSSGTDAMTSLPGTSIGEIKTAIAFE